MTTQGGSLRDDKLGRIHNMLRDCPLPIARPAGEFIAVC